MRPDPEIERLEAELHQSRVERWDVETFLAERHRAKIAALTANEDRTGARLQVAKEIADTVFVLIGKMATIAMLALWFLTGSPFGQ